MKKTEFTYQRFNLRMGLSVLVLPISYAIRYLVYAPLGIKDGFFIVMSVLTTLLGLVLYYKWTEKSNLFLRKGYYWVENDIVYIQRGTRTVEVKNVDWINGDETSAYGVKAAMLVIQCGKRKTLLFSKTLENDIGFSGTELYPIFQLVLEANPSLVKDENLRYWYEVKKLREENA